MAIQHGSLEIGPMDGGLNPQSSGLHVRDNEATELLNYHSDNGGYIAGRRGTVRRNITEASSATRCRGIHRWYKDDGSTELLVAFDNGDGDGGVIVYSSNETFEGGTADTLTALTLGSGATWFRSGQDLTFVTVLNHVLIVGGEESADNRNKLMRYDGDDVDDVTISGATLAHGFQRMTYWAKTQRLVMSGIRNTDEEAYIYFSNQFGYAPGSDTLTVNSTNFFNFVSADIGLPVGNPVEMGSYIVQFYDDKIIVLSGTNKYDFQADIVDDDHGCIAKNSIVKVDAHIWYASDDGIRQLLPDFTSRLMSNKIRPFYIGVDGDPTYNMSQVSKANIGSWWDPQNRHVGFSYQAEGDGNNAHSFVYDMKANFGRGGWTIFDFALLQSFTMDGPGDLMQVLYGRYDGFLMQMNYLWGDDRTWSNSTTLGTGDDIDRRWESKNYSMGPSHHNKQMKKCSVEMISGGSGTPNLDTWVENDYIGGLALGTVTTGGALGSFVLGTSVLGGNLPYVIQVHYSEFGGDAVGKFFRFGLNQSTNTEAFKFFKVIPEYALKPSTAQVAR